MPTKIASRKAKARRLQEWVADQIRNWLTGCDPGDVRTATMGEQGSDVILSPKAAQQWPFDGIECKNTERLQLWQALKQMESHGEAPLLFFAKNRSEVYVCLKATTFFDRI